MNLIKHFFGQNNGKIVKILSMDAPPVRLIMQENLQQYGAKVGSYEDVVYIKMMRISGTERKERKTSEEVL